MYFVLFGDDSSDELTDVVLMMNKQLKETHAKLDEWRTFLNIYFNCQTNYQVCSAWIPKMVTVQRKSGWSEGHFEKCSTLQWQRVTGKFG